MSQLEEQIVSKLAEGVRLVDDLTATRQLAELKKQYDETQER